MSEHITTTFTPSISTRLKLYEKLRTVVAAAVDTAMAAAEELPYGATYHISDLQMSEIIEALGDIDLFADLAANSGGGAA